MQAANSHDSPTRIDVAARSMARASNAAPPPAPTAERYTLRLKEVAKALGIGQRTLERERSAGRFPPPDLRIGKVPLWRPATINAWIEKGGAR
jgi:predicted DNA-binding transcriptional regulator AlpA